MEEHRARPPAVTAKGHRQQADADLGGGPVFHQAKTHGLKPVIGGGGTTAGAATVEVVPKVSGRLQSVNVRLGDPETQPLMHRMRGGFADALMRSATGTLAGAKLDWSPDPSLCVVLAAHGYPGQVRSGDRIDLPHIPGAQVFQAGTKRNGEHLETSGGRVLGVTASGATLSQAIENTYAAVRQIHFAGMHYRTDIGRKGLKRWA